MSTQINVTVDRGGLLQRNKQQTTANRQVATEQAQQKILLQAAQKEQQSRKQQEQQRLRSGIRGPVFSPDEPAANRNGIKQIFFGPNYEPYIAFDYAAGSQTVYNYYFLINSLKVKQANGTTTGLIPGHYYVRGYELINTGSGEVNRTSFEAGAGPASANAIKFLSTRSFGVSAVNTQAAGTGPANDSSSIYGNRLTFECFVKTDFGLDSDYASFTLWIDNFQLKIDNDSSSYFRVYPSSGGASITHSIGVSASSLTSWTHLAVVLINNAYCLYVGGVLAGEFSSVNPDASFQIRQLALSTTSLNSGRTDILWLSSLRIGAGARYSGNNFTPPTSIS